MISYCQELLNECQDLTQDYNILDKMKQTLRIIKDKIKSLKGGRKMQEAEYIEHLEELVRLKDIEIKDIKTECAEQFDIIRYECFRNVNEANNYGDLAVKKRKISELCTDTRYQLLIDELEENDEKAKIIELPTKTKSQIVQ